MKNSKYIKVSVSDRLPEKEGKYTVQRNDSEDYHEMYYFNGSPLNTSFWTAYVKYWLQEVPDYEEEMKEMLEECRLQLEHLNRKQRGTINSVLSRLETLLTKLKTES